MADIVLLLATQSNLVVIRVLSAYFLNSYYDVLGIVLMISALKRLHHTSLGNIMALE